ncbi:glycosyltransferase family 2 protein [Candidatus Falkowbacteria bacterium]|nr:glycosyltransferase family 2 protein [Candidatus Falkowbacteria bacterium]
MQPHILNLPQEDRKGYRRLEYIPGILIWTTLVGSIALSFFKPLWVIYFILVFSLYWVTRLFYFVFYVSIAAHRYHKEIKIDWLAKTQELAGYEDYYHIVFLPTYSEPFEVINKTLEGLEQSVYDKQKMIVVLSWEERAKQVYDEVCPKVIKAYEGKFLKLFTTLHPDGIVGEVKGKGANANWAGKQSQKIVDELGIPYEKLIVSYFDSDTVVHPQYFAHLAYKYITHPKPTRASFQPVALYSNNIWESSAPMRIVAFSTVFWLLAELMRPDRLYTFSSHSMSYRALVDVGFWQPDIVTDDSRIFLQCFIHYNSDYEVVPLFVPVSMDAVGGSTLWEGFKNLYKQQRRWAWGVEHMPYMIYNFRKRKQSISAATRLKYIFNITEGMYSWATAPLLLFVLGRLPLALARPEEKATVLAQNAPFVLETIMNVGMFGILVSAILTIILLPPRPHSVPRYMYLVMFLQWILLPVSLIFFGVIPAIDAQTRLALGKYLGFFVTPKVRKETNT